MSQVEGKVILVVEDEEDIRYAVRAFLEMNGYIVKTARNGVEALEVLEREGIPQLILLDMKMPDMNGWQFAAEFNARHDSGAPIVVMTAAAEAGRRAQDIHATGWIGKPFDFDDLLLAVKQHEK